MKNKMIMAVLFIAAISLIAQPPQAPKYKGRAPQAESKTDEGYDNPRQGILGRHNPAIPDLTDEQKTKIESLKIELMKALKPIKNKIREKEAQLQTLRTEDKPDMNKIFALVDEIGMLKTQARKEHEKHIQEIRQLLDEKQRVVFDVNHKHRPGIMPGGQGKHSMPGPGWD